MIPADEALALVRTVPVGRVALVVAGAPIVVPVNFSVLDGDVVFRTASESKLLAAMTGAVVSFEVDHFEPASRTGWSVLVSGPAAEITDPDQHARAEALGIDSWVAPHDRFVRVTARLVSGRRLRRGAGGGQEWFTEWGIGWSPG